LSVAAFAAPARAGEFGYGGRGGGYGGGNAGILGPGSCVRDYPVQRPVSCAFNVFWYDCRCARWVFYGTFSDQCSATRAVECLRCTYRVQACAQPAATYVQYGNSYGSGQGYGWGGGGWAQ
jgi:hypothetical protein